MDVLTWIVLGGLAGWVASMIMKEEGGLIKNIVVGIIGALIGGFVYGLVGGDGVDGLNAGSFLVAVIGAMILLYVVRLLRR